MQLYVTNVKSLKYANSMSYFQKFKTSLSECSISVLKLIRMLLRYYNVSVLVRLQLRKRYLRGHLEVRLCLTDITKWMTDRSTT